MALSRDPALEFSVNDSPSQGLWHIGLDAVDSNYSRRESMKTETAGFPGSMSDWGDFCVACSWLVALKDLDEFSDCTPYSVRTTE